MRNFSAFKSGFVFVFGLRLLVQFDYPWKDTFKESLFFAVGQRLDIRLADGYDFQLGLQHFFVLLFWNRFYYPNSQDFCDFEKIIRFQYANSLHVENNILQIRRNLSYSRKKGIEKGRNTTVKFRTSPLKCRLRPCFHGCNAFRYLSLRRLIVSSLLT